MPTSLWTRVRSAGRRPRTGYAVRAHEPTAAVRRWWSTLVGLAGPDDVYVVVDETSTTHRWPSSMQVLPLTPDFLDSAGLVWRDQGIGWRCGDYFHYRLRHARPDLHQSWLVEPDVHVDEPEAFFAEADRSPADLLAHNLGPRPQGWPWHGSMSRTGHPDVWGCLFPLTRLSGRATDHLLEARRALGAEFTRAPRSKYPNDEAFTATTLRAAGERFTTRSLADVSSWSFQHFVWRTKYLLSDVEQGRFGSRQVMHSVIDDEEWRARVDTAARSVLASGELAWLRPSLKVMSEPAREAMVRRLLDQLEAGWRPSG